MSKIYSGDEDEEVGTVSCTRLNALIATNASYLFESSGPPKILLSLSVTAPPTKYHYHYHHYLPLPKYH